MSAYDYEIAEAKRRASGIYKPYTVGHNHDGERAVLGPTRSFYAPSLLPGVALPEHQVERIAELANEAYRQGYATAQHDIRRVIGA